MPSFLNNINLNKYELQNARIQNLGSAPGSPVEGQVYYDTTSDTFRGYANGDWVTLGVDPGGSVISVSAGDSTITIGGTGTDPTVAVATGGITNTQINASAAIAYSKLNLSASIVNADVASGAAIAYSKLNLATSIVNADISTGAAIVYSKLNLSNSIVNADIATGAAIALSKLATDPLARANHTGSQLASTISDFDTQVRTSRLDQMAVPTASVSLNSQKITNLLDPTDAQDAVTKAYADAIASGIDVRASVRAATTGPGTLATSFENGDTIDGVTLATGNRILIKDQASGSENGIYVVAASGAPTRATDADASAEVTSGMFVFVEEGTVNADSGWVLTTNNPITLNTTALSFAQFSGAGQITAGDGLTKSGNTINAVGTSNRISVSADAIDISTSYVGQATITTLGTITTGVWNGTDIAVADGGTGASTAAAGRANLGATGVYSAAGTGSATSFTINQATHGLGTAGADYCDLVCECYDISAASAVKVEVDISINKSTGAVTFTFAASQTLTNYRFTIIGK